MSRLAIAYERRIPTGAASNYPLSEGLARRRLLRMTTKSTDHSHEFSESGFWKAARGVARNVPFLEDALAMFYCLMDSDTPSWVQALIVGALGYFVCPVDAIPDVLPVVGWLDDAGVISAALATIDAYVTPEHRVAAKRAMA